MSDNEHQIKRESFIKEQAVRKYIRKTIKELYSQHLQKKEIKNKLRGVIKEILLKEVEVADKIPHRYTGINVLEELLKKIIPIVHIDYKTMTTSQDQRQSFRAHIITAVQNTLTAAITTDRASIQEQDLDLSVGDRDPRFIDIEDSKKEKESSFKDLPDQDRTGRNMAFMTFEKIEKVILDSYETLGNDEDRKIFYDYLITNLKLYFDKFEDELSPSVEEPTTDEYEEETSMGSPDLEM